MLPTGSNVIWIYSAMNTLRPQSPAQMAYTDFVSSTWSSQQPKHSVFVCYISFAIIIVGK